MIFFNIISFYLTWLVCVFGAVGKLPEQYALFIGSVIVIAQLTPEILSRSKKLLLNRVKTIFIVTAIGVLVDSIPVIMGVVTFPKTTIYLGFYPVWLIILWVMFATSLWLSLKLIASRPLYAVIFGVVGGPLSYLAAQYYGAIEFPMGAGLALAINGIEWGVLMVCFSVNRRLWNFE